MSSHGQARNCFTIYGKSFMLVAPFPTPTPLASYSAGQTHMCSWGCEELDAQVLRELARVRADWRTRSVARAHFARDEAAATALQSIEMAASSVIMRKSLRCSEGRWTEVSAWLGSEC